MRTLLFNRTKAVKLVKPVMKPDYFDLMAKLYNVFPEIRGCEKMFTPLQIYEIIILYVLQKGNKIPKDIITPAIKDIIENYSEFKKVILKFSYENISEKEIINLFSKDEKMIFYDDKKHELYWVLVDPYKVENFNKILFFELNRTEIISVNKILEMTEEVYGKGLRDTGLLSNNTDKNLLFPYKNLD